MTVLFMAIMTVVDKDEVSPRWSDKNHPISQ